MSTRNMELYSEYINDLHFMYRWNMEFYDCREYIKLL